MPPPSSKLIDTEAISSSVRTRDTASGADPKKIPENFATQREPLRISLCPRGTQTPGFARRGSIGFGFHPALVFIQLGKMRKPEKSAGAGCQAFGNWVSLPVPL